jgi:hypothetical protein
MLDTAYADILPGETLILYQLIRRHQRRVTRIFRSVKDEYGVILTSSAGVASAFVSFYREKYCHVNVDPECDNVFANLARAEQPSIPMPDYESLFTLEEIHSGGKTELQVATASALNFIQLLRQ